MSLLIIMSFIALKINFYIVKIFLNDEKFENFNWVIEQLKKLYVLLSLKNSVVIITDRDLIFMNVIEINYSKIYNILCVWYINKNVFKNCKTTFVTQKNWEKFLIVWHVVVYAHTSTKYEKI